MRLAHYLQQITPIHILLYFSLNIRSITHNFPILKCINTTLNNVNNYIIITVESGLGKYINYTPSPFH